MSNPENFIDEVTEEVRKDRLYALLRRWGWLPVLVVLVVVGGAAWTEYSRAQQEARAQGFGDAVLGALGGADMPARRAALADIAPSGPEQAAILGLMQATTQMNGDDADPEAARATLLATAEDPDLPVVYRHLALLKVILDGGTGDVGQDGAILEELASPGAPYRTLAVEQQAVRALAAGDEATAITLFRALTDDAEATESLRRRAEQLIVVLGASPEPA